MFLVCFCGPIRMFQNAEINANVNNLKGECIKLFFILVPIALSFLLAGWALAQENRGLWGHRISSPRF